MAAVSIQTYIRGLRAFFSWLRREGYTEENLLADLKPPKAPQQFVDVLTDEEVATVLASIDTDTCSGCRNAALVVTMLDTGVRLSESTSIDLEDAHLDQGYLKVMGKGAHTTDRQPGTENAPKIRIPLQAGAFV